MENIEQGSIRNTHIISSINRNEIQWRHPTKLPFVHIWKIGCDLTLLYPQFINIVCTCVFINKSIFDIPILNIKAASGIFSSFKGVGGSRPKFSVYFVLIYVIALSLFFSKWGHTLLDYRYFWFYCHLREMSKWQKFKLGPPEKSRKINIS